MVSDPDLLYVSNDLLKRILLRRNQMQAVQMYVQTDEQTDA